MPQERNSLSEEETVVPDRLLRLLPSLPTSHAMSQWTICLTVNPVMANMAETRLICTFAPVRDHQHHLPLRLGRARRIRVDLHSANRSQRPFRWPKKSRLWPKRDWRTGRRPKCCPQANNRRPFTVYRLVAAPYHSSVKVTTPRPLSSTRQRSTWSGPMAMTAVTVLTVRVSYPAWAWPTLKVAQMTRLKWCDSSHSFRLWRHRSAPSLTEATMWVTPSDLSLPFGSFTLRGAFCKRPKHHLASSSLVASVS